MRRGNADFASLAPLTTLFMALNIVLFLVEAVKSGGLGDIDSDVLRALGASWREGLWEGEWHRLVIANFLHVNLIHIIINSMSLRALGPQAEIHFGSSNFGTLYILSGVSGFCFSQIFGGSLSAGASASLFGLIGAILAVRIIQVPVLKNAWRSSDVRHTAMWAGIYLLMGVVGLMGMVNNWAHLGGFLVGALLGGFFELWRKRRQLGLSMILSVFLLIAGLVVAARWSVFNPYYHIHQALLAEEQRQPADAEAHYREALDWAKRWNNEPQIRRLIMLHKLGRWSIDEVRLYGYSNLNYIIQVRMLEEAERLEMTGDSAEKEQKIENQND